MAQINEDLETLKTARDNMKTALGNKGQIVNNDIRTYASAIINIPSGSGSGDVKLFETEQAMQADPNPQEGDLAIVYRNETTVPSPGDTISSVTPPATVVFDTPVSGTKRLTLRGNNCHLQCTLNVSQFRISDMSWRIYPDILYTSSDGLTYTRTDTGAASYDLGEEITIPSTANTNILQFLQSGGMVFEGLYEYKTNQYVIADTQLTATPENVYEKTFYGKNGVETGTLGTPDNSFADTSAAVYTKVRKLYDVMIPRVLSDSDKDINKNIYVVPSNANGVSLLDTSSVTNMDSLFQDCKNLSEISSLNTSNATSMHSMFLGCSSLITIPQLNTSSVTNMTQMFYECSSLTTIPLLNTPNVTRMYYMFLGCSSLITIPQLNTSHVTDMFGMFSSCSSLTTIPLLDTSNATNMNYMFSNCTSLSNESLNNILAMCTNATSYTGTKTLKYIGLTSTQATTCQSLSNYQAFINAGWTTGY